MKTCNIRFPTTILCAVVTLAVLLVVPGKVEGQTEITITPVIGPRIKTQQFIDDTVYALKNGLKSYGTYVSIPDRSSINISNAFSTTNREGYGTYYALAIHSSISFTLGEISMDQSNYLGPYSTTFKENGYSYSNMGQGIGLDGTIYTNGNVDTLVNTIYVVGLGESFGEDGSLSNSLAIWAPYCPITTTMTYSVNGVTNSVSINYTEPTELSITKTGNDIVLSWPRIGYYTLQENSDLATTNWTADSNTITTLDGTNSISVSLPGKSAFFRLYP